MPTPPFIDLTSEDTDAGKGGKVNSQVSEARQDLRHLMLSESRVQTPNRKRKYSQQSDTIIVEDSEHETSTPATTTSSRTSTSATTISTPDSTPSKRMRTASLQRNLNIDHTAVKDDEMNEQRKRTQSLGRRHIDLTISDSEDAVTLISRAFPVSHPPSARRGSRLEILADPIQIQDDDSDDDDSSAGLCSATSTADSNQGPNEVITVEDFLSDKELNLWLKDIRLAEKAAKEAQPNKRSVLNIFRGVRFTCAPGKAVELEDQSFLRIKKVTKNDKGEIFVAGYHLVRQNYLGLKMPKRKNEVVWVQQVAASDRQSRPALYEVSVSQVCRNREVVFTNQRFPCVSARTDSDSLLDANQDVKFGPLFCRLMMTVVSSGKNRIVEESIEHLKFQDADDKVRRTNLGKVAYTRHADMRTRYEWRKIATIPGGSEKVFREILDLDNTVKMSEGQRYAFGDAFCGAGGTSRGAVQAGLSIKWAFDFDDQAIASYELNFGGEGTDCRHEAVHEFLLNMHSKPPIIDILHISPPCQPFSHCHTVEGCRDEVNQAALFSVWHLLETLKPRAVTIEETDALMSRHKEWFSALISIFVNLGYSVRWAALRCQKYGVPQARKRLFIIASG